MPPASRSVIIHPGLAFGAVPWNKADEKAIKAWLGDDGLVVDLREIHEHGSYEVTDWKRVIRYPIQDRKAPPAVGQPFHDLIRHIVAAMEAGNPVYIHCRGGHGRGRSCHSSNSPG